MVLLGVRGHRRGGERRVPAHAAARCAGACIAGTGVARERGVGAMRVLLANKFFYDHGGPETVLFQTRDLLRADGHAVIDFSMQDARKRPSPYASYFAPHADLPTTR